jgi:hypothetical protein
MVGENKIRMMKNSDLIKQGIIPERCKNMRTDKILTTQEIYDKLDEFTFTKFIPLEEHERIIKEVATAIIFKIAQDEGGHILHYNDWVNDNLSKLDGGQK